MGLRMKIEISIIITVHSQSPIIALSLWRFLRPPLFMSFSNVLSALIPCTHQSTRLSVISIEYYAGSYLDFGMSDILRQLKGSLSLVKDVQYAAHQSFLNIMCFCGHEDFDENLHKLSRSIGTQRHQTQHHKLLA
ncbi:uncharacterized protein LOC143862700 [Tasmannia lanceolata]|uniref:uncharacterized protein LOC143862700 n=1 Tax=Tasmannia lanceolata TaxID=3420 RepID=UPI004064B3B6